VKKPRTRPSDIDLLSFSSNDQTDREPLDVNERSDDSGNWRLMQTGVMIDFNPHYRF
jgi:hypothetical protein